MSAIAGIVRHHEPELPLDELGRLHRALTPYGPDGGGVWQEGGAGLAQRQLRLLPEDAFDRQPLLAADAPWVLVSAGRIDNRPELARETAIPQADQSELPDSAFVLRAYERWQQSTPLHLIGDYAFALFDRKNRTLRITLSPLSSHPVYYYAGPQAFVFATSPQALFALKWVPRQIDESYLARYLTRSQMPPDGTIYREIRRCLPGHTLALKGREVTRSSYWEPDYSNAIGRAGDQEIIEAFDAVFARAVSDSLRYGGNVGIMMSGGLDSTSVAAIAAPLLQGAGKRLSSYTEVSRPRRSDAVPAGRYADETPYVEAMARRYDLDAHYIHAPEHGLLERLDEYFAFAAIPFRNAFNRSWMEAILERGRQHGVRVMLDGAMGNLTASWAGSDPMPDLLRRGRLRAACREANGSVPAVLIQAFKAVLPTPLKERAASLRAGLAAGTPPPLVVNPEFARRWNVPTEGFWSVDLEARSGATGARLRTLLLQRSSASQGCLASAYRAMFGVEMRDPMQDVRVAEFCLALPNEQYRRAGVSRLLLRRAMRDRLPAEIVSQSHRGLQAADWRERLVASRVAVEAERHCIAQCSLASRALNMPGFELSLARLFGEEGQPKHLGYRNSIEYWLMTGAFLRWFEETQDTYASAALS